MEPAQIYERIANAEGWLPITTVRQAFTHHAAVVDYFLEAVQQRSVPDNSLDVRQQRLSAFGLFFLGQHRDRRLLDPLVRLFETVDANVSDEWSFGNRLFFFGHRLLAGVCSLDPLRPMELALDTTKAAMTRALAISSIGLQAAYGDIRRAQAVAHLHAVHEAVKSRRNKSTDACWALTAAKLDSRAFTRELQWFLASGRLEQYLRPVIADFMKQPPDEIFESVCNVDAMVDLFSNVFTHQMRDGEVGLVLNSRIPGFEMSSGPQSQPRSN